MAITVYSTEGAKQNSPTPKNLLPADTNQASVVYSSAQYVVDGTETSATTIGMIKIPEGYTPIGQTFALYSDGTAGSLTAKVGTDTDPDSIISTAKAVGTGGTFFAALAADAGADVGTPVTTTAAEWIVVDIAAGSSATAGKVISVSGCFAKA